MGKLKTVYKNLPLKKALIITIVSSLFIAFLGAMTILLATRPSYYALVADNPEHPDNPDNPDNPDQPDHPSLHTQQKSMGRWIYV